MSCGFKGDAHVTRHCALREEKYPEKGTWNIPFSVVGAVKAIVSVSHYCDGRQRPSLPSLGAHAALNQEIMSSTDDNQNPLVTALQRKVNYQAKRIDMLEEQLEEQQGTIEMLQSQIADEVDDEF